MVKLIDKEEIACSVDIAKVKASLRREMFLLLSPESFMCH